MKDVAARLEVGTMSLYYYVPDKAALLDAVASRLYGAIELPDPDLPWRARVDAIARQIYVSFAGVPGLDPFAVPRQPSHEERNRVVDGMLTALRAGGLDAHEAAVGATVVFGFAVGRGTAATRLPRAGTTDGNSNGTAPSILERIGTDQIFDFGLELLLDGLAQRGTPSVS